MNKRRVFLISIFVMLAVVVAGSTVLSRSYVGSNANRTGRAIEWLSSMLELTDGQKSKLSSLNEELENLEVALKKDRGQIKDELIEMLRSHEFDQVRMIELVEEKQEQVNYFAPKIIAGFANFHDSLSIEQRKKLLDEIGSHNHFDWGRRHHR